VLLLAALLDAPGVTQQGHRVVGLLLEDRLIGLDRFFELLAGGVLLAGVIGLLDLEGDRPRLVPEPGAVLLLSLADVRGVGLQRVGHRVQPRQVEAGLHVLGVLLDMFLKVLDKASNRDLDNFGPDVEGPGRGRDQTKPDQHSQDKDRAAAAAQNCGHGYSLIDGDSHSGSATDCPPRSRAAPRSTWTLRCGSASSRLPAPRA